MITLDTNIFVYLVDDRDPAKQAIAAQVIARAAALRAPVALQVVGEFQNASIRKLRLPPFVAAQAARNILTGFDVFGAAVSDADSALGQLAAGRLSYWDALLITGGRLFGADLRGHAGRGHRHGPGDRQSVRPGRPVRPGADAAGLRPEQGRRCGRPSVTR